MPQKWGVCALGTTFVYCSMGKDVLLGKPSDLTSDNQKLFLKANLDNHVCMQRYGLSHLWYWLEERILESQTNAKVGTGPCIITYEFIPLNFSTWFQLGNPPMHLLHEEFSLRIQAHLLCPLTPHQPQQHLFYHFLS